MANTDNNDQIWAKKFNTTYDTTIKNYNTNIKKELQQNREQQTIEPRLILPSPGHTNRKVITITRILCKMGMI